MCYNQCTKPYNKQSFKHTETTFDFIIHKEILDEEKVFIVEATVSHQDPDSNCDSSDIDFYGFTNVEDIEIFDDKGKKVSNKLHKVLCEEFSVYDLALGKFEDLRRAEELFECYMNEDLSW